MISANYLVKGVLGMICALTVWSPLAESSGPGASEAPANDQFEDARPIDVFLPYFASTQTAGATTQSGEPEPCGGIGATVWSSLSVTGGGIGRIVVDTVASDYDTVLAVYSGTSLHDLTLIECNDNELGEGDKSRVAFFAVPGETYFIQAGGRDGATGTLGLNVEGAVLRLPS